jgi:uncharacterized protein
MKVNILMVCILLLVSCSKNSPDNGIAALEKGDYQTALKEFQPLAEKGNFVAQNKLGNMYLNGHGVAADAKKAFQLYTQSANQG